jgi:hypothetical protein
MVNVLFVVYNKKCGLNQYQQNGLLIFDYYGCMDEFAQCHDKMLPFFFVLSQLSSM